MNALVLLAIAAMGSAVRAEAAGATDQNRAAFQAFHQRDFAACERLSREALTLAETEKDPVQAAVAAANVAAASAMRGRVEEATTWSRRALETLGGQGAPKVRGRILVAQGLILQVRGDEEGSEAAFAAARSVLGPSDWPLEYADALVKAYDWNNLSEAYQKMRTLREKAARDPERAVLAALILGWLEGVGGSPEAATSFESARALLAAKGETLVLPLIDHNLGSVLLWADRLDEAQAIYERGLAAARANRDRRLEVIFLDDLSLLFSQKEDWPRAIAADREASERLGAIAQDVRQKRLEDSLLLDLRRLFRSRYTHKPQMLIDLFLGLFDQLAVEP